MSRQVCRNCLWPSSLLVAVAALLPLSGCEDVIARPITRSVAEAGAGAEAMGGGAGLGGGAEPSYEAGGTFGEAGRGGMGQAGVAGEGSEAIVEGNVPASEYCQDVNVWPLSDSVDEESFLNSLNMLRSIGVTCGGGASGMPLKPLLMIPELRCSARVHSVDMVNVGYFSDVSPLGDNAVDRMWSAGYPGFGGTEVIAQDAFDVEPYMVLDYIVRSAGIDCLRLLDPVFGHAGVGLFQGIWTIDLAPGPPGPPAP